MSPTMVLLHFLDFSTNEVNELPWLIVLRVFFFYHKRLRSSVVSSSL